MERIAVVGAGAMGGLWAARISTAGYDVTVVDVSEDLIESIQQQGLTVLEADRSAITASVTATTDPAAAGAHDIVFVFVKGPYTRAVAATMGTFLGEETIVATLQNGWGNADVLAGSVPPERIAIGVTYHAATVLAPSRVRHPGSGPSYLGPFIDGGDIEPAARVAGVMEAAGFETHVGGDVKTAIWRKLIHNASCLAVSALTGLRAAPLVEPSPWREVIDELAREAVAVAVALGYDIEETERIESIHAVLGAAGLGVPSMLVDALGRRPTEIATINGAVVAAARETGVAVPLNEAMVELVRGLERSWVDADA